MIDLSDLRMLENKMPEAKPSPGGNTFVIKAINKIETKEEAEGLLENFNKDYWDAAKLKRRGNSLEKIRTYFHNKYTIGQLNNMIEQVIAVNNIMTINEGPLLRRQMLDELEELENIVWGGATIEGGETQLNNNQIKSLLQIKDRKIQIMGLNAPQKVEIDITHNIEDARKALQLDYSKYLEKRSAPIIDVTPVAEATSPPEEDAPKYEEEVSKYEKDEKGQNDAG